MIWRAWFSGLSTAIAAFESQLHPWHSIGFAFFAMFWIWRAFTDRDVERQDMADYYLGLLAGQRWDYQRDLERMQDQR